MALPTGSGTETLHAHHFNNTDGTQTLISGIKHHVYTVMSIIVYCNVLNATTDVGTIGLVAHDGHAGSTTANIRIARFNIQVDESFVWNDKFSFNGAEPTGTNVFSAAEQIAIAAQSGTQIQYLQFEMTHATDDYDITVTYLDQDWT
tara:strand:+ start:67 stop:507 length:441 start_codon:yes stop_codon:yes gene_type:complete